MSESITYSTDVRNAGLSDTYMSANVDSKDLKIQSLIFKNIINCTNKFIGRLR